jgi:hypothetical protein
MTKDGGNGRKKAQKNAGKLNLYLICASCAFLRLNFFSDGELFWGAAIIHPDAKQPRRTAPGLVVIRWESRR